MDFMEGRVARPPRILSEYLEPEARFDRLGIIDTVVFFGSARIHSREEAEQALKKSPSERRRCGFGRKSHKNISLL